MKKLFVALLILLSFIAISCDGNLNNPGNASEENIPAVSEDDKTQINEMRQEEKKALAKDYIIEGGYDPVYGARPLKRFVQKNVETLTARLILSGDVRADDRIIIDLENGQLTAHAVSVQDTAAS